MATVYRFNVECVSAFCSYPEEDIAKIIKEALEKFEDNNTGMTLESVSVNGNKSFKNKNTRHRMSLFGKLILQIKYKQREIDPMDGSATGPVYYYWKDAKLEDLQF